MALVTIGSYPYSKIQNAGKIWRISWATLPLLV